MSIKQQCHKGQKHNRNRNWNRIQSKEFKTEQNIILLYMYCILFRFLFLLCFCSLWHCGLTRLIFILYFHFMKMLRRLLKKQIIFSWSYNKVYYFLYHKIQWHFHQLQDNLYINIGRGTINNVHIHIFRLSELAIVFINKSSHFYLLLVSEVGIMYLESRWLC